MRDLNRTPSPPKASRQSCCRERSPWTAQRVRKKGRSGTDINFSLPKLSETDPQLSNGVLAPKRSADVKRSAMLNPFLRQLSMPAGKQEQIGYLPGLEGVTNTCEGSDQPQGLFHDALGIRNGNEQWESTSDSSVATRRATEDTFDIDDVMDHVEGRFLTDKEHGLLLLQRTPLREISQNEQNVAETPSPDMPAPGIRTNAHNIAPPRVPSTCRTIRRVLVDSPVSSRRSSWRGDENRDVTRESSPCPVPASEGRAFGRSQTIAWNRDSPFSAFKCQPLSRQQGSEPSSLGSPEFVLSKGRVTPNNLVPSWEDERAESRRHAYGGSPLQHSGPRAFDWGERLDGSEVDGEQAWQDVRSGDVKPDDIDTLNALLKAYCKVKGNPEEAEQVVKDALQGGRITPNASTYHHMTTLWTQHDQLNARP